MGCSAFGLLCLWIPDRRYQETRVSVPRCLATFDSASRPSAAISVASAVRGAELQLPRASSVPPNAGARKIMSSQYADTSALPHRLHRVLSKRTGVQPVYLRIAKVVEVGLLFGLRRDLAE
jgi:hypothetical protein